MRKLSLLIFWMLCETGFLLAQCPVTNITGNFSPANGDTLSGTYNITGNFVLGAGVTVFVRRASVNGCGSLEINAGGDIIVQGTINANDAGAVGGAGGQVGSSNNPIFIEQCSSPTDACGDIFTFGGGFGAAGGGLGGGQSAIAGLNGSGRKNRCLNFGDEGGRAGGAGGAGAGAGGSYGGTGRSGGQGGNGSLATMSTADVTCTSNPIAQGNGGGGGLAGITVGTLNGNDIDLGSGGSGAGGGGRGRFPGTAGAKGGNGGGLVKLQAAGQLNFTGSILANGGNGGNGGVGGGGGSSLRCCSDACAGVDEYTHTGAGGSGGGAGGGSGGGVLLQSQGLMTATGSISVAGGNGGAGAIAANGFTMNQSCILGNSSASAPAGTAGANGGAGGGGRIKLFFNPCISGNNLAPVTTVSGGSGFGGNGNPGTVSSNPFNQLAAGTALPATQSICFNGDPGSLSALAASGGTGTYAYQWQSQLDCIGPWSNIPGATGLSYDPPAGIQNSTCFRLVVTSGTCTAFSDTLSVNVISSQVPQVQPVGPLQACIGDTILLNTSGGPGANYQWFYNGVTIPSAIDSFIEITVGGSYTVQVAYPVGCGAVSQPVLANFISAPPAFAVALQDTFLCSGDSLDLLGLGGGTYQWLFNGNPIAGATNAGLTIGQAGQYQVEVTISGGCTGMSNTINIVQGTNPVAGLAANGPLQFCEGDSVELTASGGASYAWLVNGLPLAGNVNPLQVDQSGQYQALAIGSNGCRDTSAVIQVLVDPRPEANLSSVGNPVTCLGDTVIFYASGGGSYQWLYNGQPTGDTASYYVAGLQGDYHVVVTSAAGCTDTSVVFAFSFYPPVQPLLTTLGGSFVCPGDTAQLQAFGPGALSWIWERNDSLLPSNGGNGFDATIPGAYTATAVDQYGCQYTSANLLIYPGQAPNASLAALGDLPLCRGEGVILLAQGGNNFEWFLNGQPIQGASDSTLQVFQEGDYQVAVGSGCGSDTTDVLQVAVGIGPTAGFQWQDMPRFNAQFRDMSISGAQWFWDFGDGRGVSSSQNPLYAYQNPGEYLVTMITWDINGCSDTISMLVTVRDIRFFIPNVFSPNGDGINDFAETDFSKLTGFNFSIYDRWGKQLFHTSSLNAYWDGTFNGNLMPEGVYFYYLDGSLPGDEPAVHKGNITLLR